VLKLIFLLIWAGLGLHCQQMMGSNFPALRPHKGAHFIFGSTRADYVPISASR